jgi:hypothetical protein
MIAMRSPSTLILVLLASCGGEVSAESPSADASSSGSPLDAAGLNPDSGADAVGSDASQAASDSGPDTSIQAPSDSGPDTSIPEAGSEGGDDAALAPLDGGQGSDGAGSDDSGALAACVGSWDGGPVCSALVDIGPAVAETCIAGPVPTGTGGTIVDGTYVLTEYLRFGCHIVDAGVFEAGTPGNPLHSETVVVSGGCLQGAGHINGGPNWQTVSFTVSNGEMTAVVQCPGGQQAPQTLTYTADGSSLALYFPDNAEVFSRQ